MRLETARFGAIEVDEAQLYTFSEGLPGLEGKRFALIARGPVEWLQSIQDPAQALLLTDPTKLFADYAPPLKLDELRALEPSDAGALLVRVTTKRGEHAGELRLNLFAPLILNPAKHLAMQVPLVGSSWSTEHVWPKSEASEPEAAGATVAEDPAEA